MFVYVSCVSYGVIYHNYSSYGIRTDAILVYRCENFAQFDFHTDCEFCMEKIFPQKTNDMTISQFGSTKSRVIEDRLSLRCCDTIFYSQKLHQNRSLAHACPFVRIYCTHVHSTVDLVYLLTKFPYNASDNHGTCVYGQCSLTSISSLTTLSPFDARFVNPYYKIV